MELHPGTTIDPEEEKTLKCRQKWNKIRKAYSNFLGKPYIIPPVYSKKREKSKGGTRKRLKEAQEK